MCEKIEQLLSSVMHKLELIKSSNMDLLWVKFTSALVQRGFVNKIQIAELKWYKIYKHMKVERDNIFTEVVNRCYIQ